MKRSLNRRITTKAYEAGLTTRQLAKALDFTPQAVHQALHRWGVPLRPVGRPRKAVEAGA